MWYNVKDKLPDEPIKDNDGIITTTPYLCYVKTLSNNYYFYEVRHFIDKSFVGDNRFYEVVAWSEIDKIEESRI